MRPKLVLILLVAASAMAAMTLVFQPRHGPPANLTAQALNESIPQPADSPERLSSAVPPAPMPKPRSTKPGVSVASAELPTVSATNKLERLAQIRAQFHALAAGQPEVAMRAAKQIFDETERETALLALATEWSYGNLRRPYQRAEDIARFGIEAGLGMELVGNPQLALAWADELTAGPGRQALLTQTAIALTGSDPAAAFAIADQLPADQKASFFTNVFAGWGGKDTEAALQWANQLPEADREAAIQAIRTEAPVGIGTSVAMKGGYPTIMHLIPGTPAELSGQLHDGDRILALAQGDNAFINAQGVPLADVVNMIRGLPGTTVQLQILSADAPPGSSPQTISIVRDQLKFKR